MSAPGSRACSLRDIFGPYWTGSQFSAEALPSKKGQASQEALAPPPPSFLAYLSSQLLLPPGDYLEACRDAWAFTVSAAIQCAVALAYSRLGLRFTNRSMSSNYLLSCLKGRLPQLCGCQGADVPSVFKLLATSGTVTFSQFPYYTSEDLSRRLYDDIDVEYFCKPKAAGACTSCAGPSDYQEVVLPASRDQGSFRFLVPCLPCLNPQLPKYYPKAPFVVAAGDPARKAEAIKRELLRLGPLCTTLRIDHEAFFGLFSGGDAPLVSRAEEGVFYRPHSTRLSEELTSLLLVGYVSSSEGSDGGFWICQSQNGGSNFGYALKGVAGLVNVDMLREETGILDLTVSFEKILVQVSRDEAPRDLRATDPFVEKEATGPFVEKASFESTEAKALASSSAPQESPPARTPSSGVFLRTLLIVAAALVICVGLLLLLLPFPPSDG